MKERLDPSRPRSGAYRNVWREAGDSPACGMDAEESREVDLSAIIDDIFEDVTRVFDGLMEDNKVEERFLRQFFRCLLDVRDAAYSKLEHAESGGDAQLEETEDAFARERLHPTLERFMIRIGRR